MSAVLATETVTALPSRSNTDVSMSFSTRHIRWNRKTYPTRSPTFHFLSPSPTAATSPTISWPGTMGYGTGM